MYTSFLNYKAIEEEGIYRISGSAQQINYYKQKFDEGMSFSCHNSMMALFMGRANVL